MPKLRTKKALKKRFKITKTGKVIHLRAGNSKLKAKKPTSKKRRYDAKIELTNTKKINMVKRGLAK